VRTRMPYLRLGRLYDPHAAAISLGFHSQITNVSDSNPTVAKLLVLRNEYLAHRGTGHVTKGTLSSLPSLNSDEITTLIGECKGVGLSQLLTDVLKTRHRNQRSVEITVVSIGLANHPRDLVQQLSRFR
jgi:hypothetical protein